MSGSRVALGVLPVLGASRLWLSVCRAGTALEEEAGGASWRGANPGGGTAPLSCPSRAPVLAPCISSWLRCEAASLPTRYLCPQVLPQFPHRLRGLDTRPGGVGLPQHKAQAAVLARSFPRNLGGWASSWSGPPAGVLGLQQQGVQGAQWGWDRPGEGDRGRLFALG